MSPHAGIGKELVELRNRASIIHKHHDGRSIEHVRKNAPGLRQFLLGDDAYVPGLVQSPSGVSSIAMMVVGGILPGRGTGARWLVGGGLPVMAAGCYWMALRNLYGAE